MVCKVKDINRIIRNVDIIICATSAPEFIVKKSILQNIDRNKKLYFFDLSVPRNIEPEILHDYPTARLIDLDDLKKWHLEQNVQNVTKILTKAKEIVIHHKYLYEKIASSYKSR